MLNDYRQQIYKTISFIKCVSKDNPALSKAFILIRSTRLNKDGYRIVVPNLNEQLSMDKLISQRLEDILKFFDWYNEDIKVTNLRLRKYIAKYIEKRESLQDPAQIEELNRFLTKYIDNYLKSDDNFNRFMEEKSLTQ